MQTKGGGEDGGDGGGGGEDGGDGGEEGGGGGNEGGDGGKMGGEGGVGGEGGEEGRGEGGGEGGEVGEGGGGKAEIRPLLESIDIPIVCAYVLQAETAASLVVQVPSVPLHLSQPICENQARPAVQLPEVQAESIMTVSPAQLLHVHVVVSAVGGSAVDETFVTRQGGHSSVAAQQPLLPTLEPSAHVAAEAPAAKTSTITNAVSLPTKAIRGPFAARAAARAAAAR